MVYINDHETHSLTSIIARHPIAVIVWTIVTIYWVSSNLKRYSVNFWSCKQRDTGIQIKIRW